MNINPFYIGIIPAYAGNTSRNRPRTRKRRDHPRVCGEHRTRVHIGVHEWGSSPRMRGTQREFWHHQLPYGIIPAYAGNTATGEYPLAGIRDHPRVCGEHEIMEDTGIHAIGIIPAYAGNTPDASRLIGTGGDHPRVCGEHALSHLVFAVVAGSSPRMRGTRIDSLKKRISTGIIPAYAGNTCRPRLECGCFRDHPRVCGEHTLSALPAKIPAGSSPRMRGTLGISCRQERRPGIIPAYAGNTLPFKSLSIIAWDHPRVCGEHMQRLGSVLGVSGSSPRMRGTLSISFFRVLALRIIPAYAGNTCEGRRRCGQDRDHPRVCGEHVLSDEAFVRSQGSSPRMRGTPLVVDRHHGVTGIIPAYAGNTDEFRKSSVILEDHPRVCGEHDSIHPSVIPATGSSPRMRGTPTGATRSSAR